MTFGAESEPQYILFASSWCTIRVLSVTWAGKRDSKKKKIEMVHFSFFFHASLAKDVIHPELFRNFSPPSGLPAAAVSAVVFIVKILTESRSQDPAFPQSPSC
jgi:hypothetical protein